MNTNSIMLHPSRLIIAVNLLLVVVVGLLSVPADARAPTRNRGTITIEEPQVDLQRDHDDHEDSRADYLNGEEEFQQLLERLKQEAELTPIKEDRRNYVGDNADIGRILEMINQAEVGQQAGLAGFIQEEAPAANLASPHRPIIEEDENSCPICYEPMDSTTRNTRLECGHEFHRRCLQSWGAYDSYRGRRCPMCRQGTSRVWRP